MNSTALPLSSRFVRALLRDLLAFVLLGAVSLTIGEAVYGMRKPPSPFSKPPLSLGEFQAGVGTPAKALILDARPWEEYARGHVPGSLSFPGGYIEGSYLHMKLELEASRSKPIFVYCADERCGLSEAVQRALETMKFTDVRIFPGGWAQWQRAGGRQERSPTGD